MFIYLGEFVATFRYPVKKGSFYCMSGLLTELNSELNMFQSCLNIKTFFLLFISEHMLWETFALLTLRLPVYLEY